MKIVSQVLMKNLHHILNLFVFIPSCLQAIKSSFVPSFLAFQFLVLVPPVRMVTKSRCRYFAFNLYLYNNLAIISKSADILYESTYKPYSLNTLFLMYNEG